MFYRFSSVYVIALIMSTCPLRAKAQADSVSHNLDYYLERAIKNSPLLKDYANQFLANRLDSLTIHAQNRPQVNGNASALFEPTNRDNTLGYDAAITNGGNYAAQVSATQNILNGNILKPQYMGVNIQGQTLKNTAKLSEHDLRHNVISQYISLWSDKSQLDNARKVSALIELEEKILRPLVEQGMIKQSAYLSLSLEKTTDELTLKQLQIQFNVD